jgi:membrane protein implicated in regulation of membrane protease activity
MSKLTPIQNPFRGNTPETYPPSRFATSLQADRRQEGTTAQDSSNTLAGMLLAAVVAAVLVVADQVIHTWADGQLLAGWVGLWVITFALLSYLAPSLRQMSTVAAGVAQRWAGRRAARQAEDTMWELAQHDHRLVGELRAAQMRDRGEAE